ncbi:MAG TPA: peptide-methionine (S)-S-oxide reductase MsrA [Halanaerobiales bacterium]|nr:peptide-methionine (S)-S-oxide reductase MsrA [Halanaerobiales bacterium]HPZ62025.1 peptide-methionine (S)-S-oxide reductase MsrA [Halanaerobiales bacterium]HQD03251.1 peptide-methionine (S)-S-oxide reductase MsrA [Halanaerobiales bacterium]
MKNYEQATLGGGCFWCLEAVYKDLKGVVNILPGYSGGHTENPTYEEVCTDTTGHAEVVQITYDPVLITYQDLLEIFFFIHDPTSLNRQGADEGTQYRSVVFYHNEEQKDLAYTMIKNLEEEQVYEDPIVTELVKLDKFYPAEEYHHNYYARNPEQAYCSVVIAPKLARFREKYHEKLEKS